MEFRLVAHLILRSLQLPETKITIKNNKNKPDTEWINLNKMPLIGAFGIAARLDFEMFIMGYVLIEERSMKGVVLAPTTYAKICKKVGTAVWTGDRSIKSFRTGCFKMRVCKLRHNLNILFTRDSEVLSSWWVLDGESTLKQIFPSLQQFFYFQPCSFWIGWAVKILSPLLIRDPKEMWWCSFSFSFRSDTV